MLESRNPLDKNFNTSDDKALVRKALDGSRKALNELLETHNMFIYNISIKMIGDIEQAKDLTQDILVKITANLSKYNPEKGEFRSWLYRMAFNHILDHKKSSTEKKIKSFSELFQTLDQMVDEPLSEETGFLDDNHPYTNEVKVKCTSGMLMCLSREQRLLYIIGDLFQIDHNLGAEIFDISKENFRKKLSRTRKELHQWMHNKCGLVNKDNPCRCAKKTKGFIESGVVDPNDLVWNKKFKHKIEAFSSKRLTELQLSSDDIYQKLYLEHPMREPKTADEVLSTVLGDKNLREVLDI